MTVEGREGPTYCGEEKKFAVSLILGDIAPTYANRGFRKAPETHDRQGPRDSRAYQSGFTRRTTDSHRDSHVNNMVFVINGSSEV